MSTGFYTKGIKKLFIIVLMSVILSVRMRDWFLTKPFISVTNWKLWIVFAIVLYDQSREFSIKVMFIRLSATQCSAQELTLSTLSWILIACCALRSSHMLCSDDTFHALDCGKALPSALFLPALNRTKGVLLLRVNIQFIFSSNAITFLCVFAPIYSTFGVRMNYNQHIEKTFSPEMSDNSLCLGSSLQTLCFTIHSRIHRSFNCLLFFYISKTNIIEIIFSLLIVNIFWVWNTLSFFWTVG